MYTLGCVATMMDDCLPPVWEFVDDFTSAPGSGDAAGWDDKPGDDENIGAVDLDASTGAGDAGANGSGDTVGTAT